LEPIRQEYQCAATITCFAPATVPLARRSRVLRKQLFLLTIDHVFCAATVALIRRSRILRKQLLLSAVDYLFIASATVALIRRSRILRKQLLLSTVDYLFCVSNCCSQPSIACFASATVPLNRAAPTQQESLVG
jgi:hypothetical protein